MQSKKRRIVRLISCALAVAMLAIPASATPNAKIDSARPYNAPDSGLFHDQAATNDQVTGTYSIYIPAALQPKSPAVILLTPDNTTAEAFSQTEIGKGWIDAAQKNLFATVFLEPANGGSWNLTDSAAGRDEGALIKRVFQCLRDKSVNPNAFMSTDKNHVSLVGYEQGGAMAHLMAAEWPNIFANMVTIDATEAPKAQITAASRQLSVPFIADNENGQEDVKLPNNKIPLPVWMITSGKETNIWARDFWVKINDVSLAANDPAASKVYSAKGTPARVWVTEGHRASLLSADDIYTQFIAKNGRFMGYPGGTLKDSIPYTNYNGYGYFKSEEVVDGAVRRWMTYVPASYRSNKGRVPVVISMHGYSAAMTDMPEESRWSDVADKYGFIVVYPQGYPNTLKNGNIPIPAWNCELFPMVDGATDDVAFLKHMVAQTKKTYRVDDARVYLSGHSNGSAMTWYMGYHAPELFAAIAPVGFMASYAEPKSDLLVPAWTFKGEYDLDGYKLDAGSANLKVLDYWAEYNGLPTTAYTTDREKNAKFNTRTYTNDAGVPLLKYTAIEDSPHVYFEDEAWMIWEQFFSKYTRGTDGTLYYDGAAVTR